MTITASAPGKLMLLGEHAVLHGRLAVVCAVNQRITVELTPRQDDAVHIQSELGTFAGRIDALSPERPFRFVIAALIAGGIPGGCDLAIHSDFSDQVGLGSSAAVTVAVCAATDAWLGRETDPLDLVRRARDVVRTVQGGAGSGADVAASVFGGTLAYRADPLEITPLAADPQLTVVYSGSKTPTPEVIAIVDAQLAAEPDRVKAIFDDMNAASDAAALAVNEGDWAAFGRQLNAGGDLMTRLNLNTADITAIVAALDQQPDITGAKISGSGLGDCVIGLGTIDDTFPFSTLSLTVSPRGVEVEQSS
jgi:mevalonate kinase